MVILSSPTCCHFHLLRLQKAEVSVLGRCSVLNISSLAALLYSKSVTSSDLAIVHICSVR